MTGFLEFKECRGCGELFPIRSPYVHNAKWCSERCRKGQYAGTCVDCGSSTNGYDGPGKAAVRCQGCDAKQIGPRKREQFRVQRELVERLWAEGKKVREIADAMGWTGNYRQQGISILRRRGYDLPHRYPPERIAPGAAERMAHARAARKVAA